MLGKIPAARLALIEKIVAHALRELPRDAAFAGRAISCARSSAASPRKTCARIARDLAAAALAHLEFGRQRKGNRVLVDIAPPLDARCAHRLASRAVARGRARHALPRGLHRHRVQPDEHRRAPHRAPGAGGAPRRARRAQDRRHRTARRAARILADDGDRPAARRGAGAASSSAACAPRSKTCAAPSPISARMLERIRAVANELERAPATRAAVACQRSARPARLDARRTLRLPRLSLLPPEARPLARRAGARPGSGLGILRESARPQDAAAHRAHRATCAGRRARPSCWC